MTKEVVEMKMVDKVKELIEIYKEYNPNGDYLSIGIFIKSGHININNTYWDEDVDAPVNVCINEENEND